MLASIDNGCMLAISCPFIVIYLLQPVVSEKETEDGLRSVTFDRTPIMSTYLLAFIVGEYDYAEGRDSDGVLIRVYTPVGKNEQGNFALEVRYFTIDAVSAAYTHVLGVVFS